MPLICCSNENGSASSMPLPFDMSLCCSSENGFVISLVNALMGCGPMAWHVSILACWGGCSCPVISNPYSEKESSSSFFASVPWSLECRIEGRNLRELAEHPMSSLSLESLVCDNGSSRLVELVAGGGFPSSGCLSPVKPDCLSAYGPELARVC
nr:hypothetical protein Iba_chr04dCG3300 [Ipomoea batatas]